jgi:hypothetical protein
MSAARVFQEFDIRREGLHQIAPLFTRSPSGSAQGNDKWKSDAVKQQYWLYVCMQKQPNQIGGRPSLSRPIA